MSGVMGARATPLDNLVQTMKLRFTSANTVPVERAYIRREEWELLLSKLAPSILADRAESAALQAFGGEGV